MNLAQQIDMIAKNRWDKNRKAYSTLLQKDLLEFSEGLPKRYNFKLEVYPSHAYASWTDFYIKHSRAFRFE